MTPIGLGDEASVGTASAGSGLPPTGPADAPERIALLAVRGYKRWISPHTRPCPTRVAGGSSCSTRAADALIRHGLIAGLLVAAPQVWACCGNPHRPVPGHGGNRYGTAGRRQTSRWN